MEERMKCNDADKVRPLDELLDDQIREFDTGEDKECDRDLDAMIWKLGDYENEESLLEAEEFAEESPIEEELVEKKIIAGGSGRASFVEGGWAEEEVTAGEKLATARSLGPVTARKRTKAIRVNPGKKKK